jgi:hypothetical protein
MEAREAIGPPVNQESVRMTLAEFLRRAHAVGCDLHVSGALYFLSRNGITVRIDTRDSTEAPHYAIAHIKKGHDISYQPATPSAASRALKLPRR